MNEIDKYEAEQIAKLSEKSNIPDFDSGDTIRVNVRVTEGTRERIQGYEGVCIAKGGKGINKTFTVRKISYGEGVERVFPFYSPRIESVVLIRRGDVRRSKLYFLRDRRGKAARITERKTGRGFNGDNAKSKTDKKVTATAKAKSKPATVKDKKVAATG